MLLSSQATEPREDPCQVPVWVTSETVGCLFSPLHCKWLTSVSAWAESLKTLRESSILSFSGTGGITQKASMLGMQAGGGGTGGGAAPPVMVQAWKAQPHGRGRQPLGRGALTDISRELLLRVLQTSFSYIHSHIFRAAQEHGGTLMLILQLEKLKHRAITTLQGHTANVGLAGNCSLVLLMSAEWKPTHKVKNLVNIQNKGSS